MLDEFKTSSANKKKIKEFICDKQLIGVRKASITPYLSAVTRLLGKVNKGLDKIKESDFKNYFSEMQNSKSESK